MDKATSTAIFKFLSLCIYFFGSWGWAHPASLDYHHRFFVKEFKTLPTRNLTVKPSEGNESAQPIKYRAIVPSDYPSCPDQDPCYGVVYFLHGRGNDLKMLESFGAIPALANLQRQVGQIKFIIVAPSGDASYWLNAAEEPNGRQRWSDAIAIDLVDDVERRFGFVKKHPKARVIAGISMGGHGALQIAMNHPGVFSAVAAHSPVLRSYEDTRELGSLFGDEQQYRQRDPYSLLMEKKANNVAFADDVWLDVGALDWAFDRTWQFAQLLKEVIPPKHLTMDGSRPAGHEMQYWQDRLPEYLNWYHSVLSR